MADFKEDPEKESQANSGSGANKEKSSRRREWSLCPQCLETQVSWKCPWDWLHELLWQSAGSRNQVKLEQARGGWMGRIQRTSILTSPVWICPFFSLCIMESHSSFGSQFNLFLFRRAVLTTQLSLLQVCPISFSYVSFIKAMDMYLFMSLSYQHHSLLLEMGSGSGFAHYCAPRM